MKRILKGLLLGLTFGITILVAGLLGEPVEAAVGDTIAQTFSDGNLSQLVADKVAGGDTNAIITQTMVDNTTYLYANNRNIQDVTGIEVFKNMGWLYLNDNKISQLSESISQLAGLRVLDLSNNQLTGLPESVGSLSKLQMLFLYKNNLTTLPESIGDLDQLTWLHLDDNNLTSLKITSSLETSIFFAKKAYCNVSNKFQYASSSYA